MTQGQQSRAAVIGLGSMGMGAAKSLLRAGWTVTGCDAGEAQRKAWTDAGGTLALTPAEAAREVSAAVVLVVNAAQTEEVLFGPDGAANGLPQGAVILSCATMAPEDARRLAAMAAEKGLLYLDAPLSGGAAKAASGELTVMASGAPETFAAARPVLDVIAAKVYELGDEPGQGSAYKIVNQLLAGAHIAAACEAMTFAAKLGLDLNTVYDVITASAGNSWMFENRVPHILDGDYTPRSAVSIFTKDLGIVTGIAHKAQLPLPVASTALQLFLATAASGMARDDDASVARMMANVAGVELPARKA